MLFIILADSRARMRGAENPNKPSTADLTLHIACLELLIELQYVVT